MLGTSPSTLNADGGSDAGETEDDFPIGLPGIPPRNVPLNGKLPPPLAPLASTFWWGDVDVAEHATSSSLPYAFNEVWDGPIDKKGYQTVTKGIIDQIWTTAEEVKRDDVYLPELRETRRRAKAEVLLNGPCSSDIPAVTALLADNDMTIRAMAIEAVARDAPACVALAPQVAALLEDEFWNVRHAAVRAFGNMGSGAKPYAGEIAGRLQDRNSLIQRAACEALAALEEEGVTFAPKVAVFLGSYDWQLRVAALRTLMVMGEPGARAGMKVLGDPDAPTEARASAADLLAAMGEADVLGDASDEVIAALEEALSDDMQSVVRRKACAALGSSAVLGEKDSYRIAGRLAEMLDEADPGTSRAAAEALTRMDAEAAAPHIPALLALHRRSDLALDATSSFSFSEPMASTSMASRKSSTLSSVATPRGSVLGNLRLSSERGSTLGELLGQFSPSMLHPSLAGVGNNITLTPVENNMAFSCSKKGNGRLSYLGAPRNPNAPSKGAGDVPFKGGRLSMLGAPAGPSAFGGNRLSTLGGPTELPSLDGGNKLSPLTFSCSHKKNGRLSYLAV